MKEMEWSPEGRGADLFSQLFTDTNAADDVTPHSLSGFPRCVTLAAANGARSSSNLPRSGGGV